VTANPSGLTRIRDHEADGGPDRQDGGGNRLAVYPVVVIGVGQRLFDRCDSSSC
jgi:hypothetical protein